MGRDWFQCGNVNLLIYLLVILFGVSSWVDINGLWVELPILVQKLPEGWDLPSYMSTIVQVANIGPLAYTIASTIYPHRAIEVPVIYFIIGTGAVSCMLLAFLWEKTLFIGGTEHSVALFGLQFFLALVDCTSSVAFLPFMSLFKPQYMTAYFVGEGFSGLIPSLVALGQGVGDMKCVNSSSWSSDAEDVENSSSVSAGLDGMTTTTPSIGVFSNATDIFMNMTLGVPAPVSFSVYPQYQPPKFTVRVFFLVLMGLLVISGLSFTLLNYWSYSKRQYSDEGVSGSSSCCDGDTEADLSTTPINSVSNLETAPPSDDNMKLKSVTYHASDNTNTQALCASQNKSCSNKAVVSHSKSNNPGQYSYAGSSSSCTSSSGSNLSASKKRSLRMSKSHYVLYLALTAWLCALSNGFLPSIQTYSCLPFGIRPYHLAVTLSSIANPVACFATFLVKMTSATTTIVMSVLSTALSAFILFTAFASPDPPLVDHSMGAFVIILAWVLAMFLLTYSKVAIATMCRLEGRRALLWVGVNTQVGSLVGAIVSFLLVNHFKLFNIANPCE